MGDDLICSAEAAEMLGIVDSTLISWRARKYGPQWITTDHGQIRYRFNEVEAWIADHQRAEHSSDKPFPRWKPVGRGGSKV